MRSPCLSLHLAWCDILNYRMVSEQIAKQIIDTFTNGNKVILIGNGGSATQSSHFANEFLVKYKKRRQSLPAIALTDPGCITAVGNDFGFKYVFSRPLSALGKKGDLLIALSTSGTSENVLHAIRIANAKGIQVLDFPKKGKDVGEIQNYQVKLMHEVVELVENAYI